MADLETFCLLLAKLNTLPFSSQIRLRRLNWQTDRLNERFDLILGSDILYEQVQWEYLDAFWRNHLSDDGAVLLGEPGRESGNLFVPWIIAKGWRLREIRQVVKTRELPVRILELKKQG